MTTLVTPVSGYSHQFNATGKRTQAVELTGRTLNWNYDGINRLTQETIADTPASKNGVVSYSLDPVGNRLSDTSSLSGVSTSSSTFNADDELSNETYDASGDTVATGGNSYAYNSWLRLSTMNGGQFALSYNGLGQLVSKTVGGVTTQYLIDDLSPTGYPQVVEELVNGEAVRSYTYGLERINELQTVNGTQAASFYQYDGRGTVRILTNSAGAVTDTYEYDAFGNEIAQTGTTPNAYFYRGERYDSDLGLSIACRGPSPLTTFQFRPLSKQQCFDFSS